MSKNIDLKDGERELGVWTINYIPPSGGKYLGKLTVTNLRLNFKSQFDLSAIAKGTAELAGAAAVAGALGLDRAFVTYSENLMQVEIPKEEIVRVKVEKKVFSKSVAIKIKNGSVHKFDYGMLSVDKLIEAIESK